MRQKSMTRAEAAALRAAIYRRRSAAAGNPAFIMKERC
jgi:hypothetical protein